MSLSRSLAFLAIHLSLFCVFVVVCLPFARRIHNTTTYANECVCACVCVVFVPMLLSVALHCCFDYKIYLFIFRVPHFAFTYWWCMRISASARVPMPVCTICPHISIALAFRYAYSSAQGEPKLMWAIAFCCFFPSYSSSSQLISLFFFFCYFLEYICTFIWSVAVQFTWNRSVFLILFFRFIFRLSFE